MTLPKNKISVIIPFYNEENTLNSVFNNLVKLSFIDQIILVNDGSTDDSLNIAGIKYPRGGLKNSLVSNDVGSLMLLGKYLEI